MENYFIVGTIVFIGCVVNAILFQMFGIPIIDKFIRYMVNNFDSTHDTSE